MGIFQYNSYHKIITAFILVGWTIFHFATQDKKEDFYESGQIKVIGDKEQGKNIGTWTWYYETGQKKMQGFFKKGKREGKWIIWHPNGNIASEMNYINDRLNGNYISWNSQGELLSNYNYINDKIQIPWKELKKKQ